MKHAVSALVAILAAVVGVYVAIVALRNEGRGTHLGSDTIFVVSGAAIALFTFGLVRLARAEKEDRKKVASLVSLAVPLATLGVWTWLLLTGHVVSHEAMLSTK